MKTVRSLVVLFICVFGVLCIIASGGDEGGNNNETYDSSCSSPGACSWHGGVDCSAGADFDGSVICNDGWRDSSVTYVRDDPVTYVGDFDNDNQTPAGECVNIEGKWYITERATSNCESSYTTTYMATVSQDGCSVIISSAGISTKGTLNGNQLSTTLSYPIDGESLKNMKLMIDKLEFSPLRILAEQTRRSI